MKGQMLATLVIDRGCTDVPITRAVKKLMLGQPHFGEFHLFPSAHKINKEDGDYKELLTLENAHNKAVQMFAAAGSC
ncbi:unnamed protein product [Caretta caretta]